MITNRYAYFENLEELRELYLSANKENSRSYKGMNRRNEYDRQPDISFDTIIVVRTPSIMWTHGKKIAEEAPKKVIVHRAIPLYPKIGETYCFQDGCIAYKINRNDDVDDAVKRRGFEFLYSDKKETLFVKITPEILLGGRFNPKAVVDSRGVAIYNVYDYNSFNFSPVIETASPYFIIEGGRIVCTRRLHVQGLMRSNQKKRAFRKLIDVVGKTFGPKPDNASYVLENHFACERLHRHRPSPFSCRRFGIRDRNYNEKWKKVRTKYKTEIDGNFVYKPIDRDMLDVRSSRKLRIYPLARRKYKSIYPIEMRFYNRTDGDRGWVFN